MPEQPDIIAREEWGAQPFRGTPTPMDVGGVVLHHSAASGDDGTRGDFESTVRGHQRHHQESNGWRDIGYQYLIGTGGHIARGRPLSNDGGYVVGAHVGGYNTGRVGICLLGCFHPPEVGGPDWCTDDFGGAQRRALVDLLRWLLQSEGLAGEDVKMHRDFDATACPGDRVADQLDSIREAATESEDEAEGESGRSLRAQVEEQIDVMREAQTRIVKILANA
jgi:hypothetical protein